MNVDDEKEKQSNQKREDGGNIFIRESVCSIGSERESQTERPSSPEIEPDLVSDTKVGSSDQSPKSDRHISNVDSPDSTDKESSCIHYPHCPYVASIQVIHVSGHVYYAYVGYGNGIVAVFNLTTAECLKYWNVPNNDAIISIEIALSIGAIIILSGNKLSIWNCKNFELIKT